jgi:FixJ family two-component response regulator
MAPTTSSSAKQPAKGARPKVLIVDDEPAMLETIKDLVKGEVACSLMFAHSVGQAEQMLAAQHVDLMLTDLHLPDGSGMKLLPALRKAHPAASAVVMTGHPSMDTAIDAMRNGAADFLPKPFSAKQFVDRLKVALTRQSVLAQQDKKIGKLKVAVKKLNEARKLVSKKVDLLCNDLVTAYGDLAKQLDGVRNQEGFRKYIDHAKDLEQLLCHAMDWLLRQMGYANVAVYLAGEQGEFQLGAYMKYTTPGDLVLTEALKRVMVPKITRESFVTLGCDQLKGKLTKEEMHYLDHQQMVGVNCTYLGESLAVIMFFRDEGTPFKEEDVAMLQSISPIFAMALASVVRDVTGSSADSVDEDPTDRPPTDDPKSSQEEERRKRDHKDDWWKRGEPPPF